MRNVFGRYVIGAAMTAVLAGCGGGGSDGGSDDPNSPGTSDIPTVDGTYKYVLETGMPYQISVAGSNYAVPCEAADGYFESENVMVYSGGVHSTEDLQRVASVAEFAMDKLVPKFGFQSMGEFDQQRRIIDYSLITYYAETIGMLTVDDGQGGTRKVGLDELSPYFADKVPSGYASWTDEALSYQLVVEAFYNNLLLERDGTAVAAVMSEVADSYFALTGDSTLQNSHERIYPKMQICALPPEDNAFGEGTLSGIIVPSNASFEIYVHEGAHYIQNQYTPDLPRWASEGQAVAFAGQRTASSEAPFNLIEVLSYADEPTGDTNAYDYYGLGYKALAKHNTVEDIMAWFQLHGMNLGSEMDASSPNPQYDLTKAAFETVLTGRDGATITYEEFGNTYVQLAQ